MLEVETLRAALKPARTSPSTLLPRLSPDEARSQADSGLSALLIELARPPRSRRRAGGDEQLADQKFG
jgi:hypothetical protein